MSDLVAGFIKDLLEEIFTAMDTSLLWVLDGMLHVENLMDGSLSNYITVNTISMAYSFMYTLASALVVLKLLFKGFQIYILWRDGDADSSPQDMVVGAMQAVVMIVIFPSLYDIMADVTIQISRGIMNIFRLTTSGSSLFDEFLNEGALPAMGIVGTILLLIFIIMALVLAMKMISRGFELMVLRIGMPIACIGLVDSDYGVFKGYMQIVLKAMFTSIIQILMMSLAFRIVMGLSLFNILFGIAIAMTAFSTPVLMQQVLVPGGRGGGGITGKMYSASMAMRSLRGLIGK